MRSGKICSLPHSFLIAVAACALYFGPFGPTGRPGPDDHPDGAETRLLLFCGLYGLLSYLPPAMEDASLSSLAPVVVYRVSCFCCHFFLEKEKKSWRRRPIAVLTVLLIAINPGKRSPISLAIRRGART